MFGWLKARFPDVATLTTAHLCSEDGDWRSPRVPCCNKSVGVCGQPVQDPEQIKRRHIDLLTPVRSRTALRPCDAPSP